MFRFEIETDSLTVGDMLLLEDVQEGKRPFHGMVSLMGRFLADEEGNLLGEEAARAKLAALKFSELTEIAKAFGDAIQKKALPRMTGGG